METIPSDIVGPYETYEFETNFIRKGFYFITITDHFTRYLQIHATDDITSKKIIEAFKQ